MGLFMKLARGGYADAELSAFASYEEMMIDEVFTADDLAYIDDDLDALIVQTGAVLHAKTHCERRRADGSLVDLSAEVETAEQYLAFLRRLKTNGIPPKTAPKIARHVYRVRAFNDMTRVMLLDGDRTKIEAGYSPWVVAGRSGWGEDGAYTGTGILWEPTVRSALAHMDADPAPPIRVPGFLLNGDRVAPVETMRPRMYEERWKAVDLDGYLQAWARVKGERRCLACLSSLPTDSDGKRRYCSERCRNAEKQRRHRERNPDAVERAQKKYWDSIDLTDD